ncbi:MAG: hypothetical protein PHH11_00385 [Methylomonas sp.]|nr:hypothetical protein [Methylomonas sp.]
MDKSLIAEASKHLRLGSINLYEGNLKRFESLPETGELGQQTKLGVKAKKKDLSTSEQSVSILRVFVDLGTRVVNLAVPAETDPTPLYQIEAVFQVDYELTGSIEQEALDEFARFNAVHNVWPFWRQYVFSVANQAGLPCPEVPLNTSLQSLENLSQQSV